MEPRPASQGAPSAPRRRAAVLVLAPGAVSAVLYLLLFLFADQRAQLAAQTRQGEEIGALVLRAELRE